MLEHLVVGQSDGKAFLGALVLGGSVRDLLLAVLRVGFGSCLVPLGLFELGLEHLRFLGLTGGLLGLLELLLQLLVLRLRGRELLLGVLILGREVEGLLLGGHPGLLVLLGIVLCGGLVLPGLLELRLQSVRVLGLTGGLLGLFKVLLQLLVLGHGSVQLLLGALVLSRGIEGLLLGGHPGLLIVLGIGLGRRLVLLGLLELGLQGGPVLRLAGGGLGLLPEPLVLGDRSIQFRLDILALSGCIKCLLLVLLGIGLGLGLFLPGLSELLPELLVLGLQVRDLLPGLFVGGCLLLSLLLGLLIGRGDLCLQILDLLLCLLVLGRSLVCRGGLGGDLVPELRVLALELRDPGDVLGLPVLLFLGSFGRGLFLGLLAGLFLSGLGSRSFSLGLLPGLFFLGRLRGGLLIGLLLGLGLLGSLNSRCPLGGGVLVGLHGIGDDSLLLGLLLLGGLGSDVLGRCGGSGRLDGDCLLGLGLSLVLGREGDAGEGPLEDEGEDADEHHIEGGEPEEHQIGIESEQRELVAKDVHVVPVEVVAEEGHGCNDHEDEDDGSDPSLVVCEVGKGHDGGDDEDHPHEELDLVSHLDGAVRGRQDERSQAGHEEIGGRDETSVLAYAAVHADEAGDEGYRACEYAVNLVVVIEVGRCDRRNLHIVQFCKGDCQNEYQPGKDGKPCRAFCAPVHTQTVQSRLIMVSSKRPGEGRSRIARPSPFPTSGYCIPRSAGIFRHLALIDSSQTCLMPALAEAAATESRARVSYSLDKYRISR